MRLRSNVAATTAVLGLAVVLTACSSSSTTAGSGTSAGSSTSAGSATSGGSASSAGSSATAGGKYKIALIPGVANDAYYGSVACGVKSVAEAAGSSVDVQAPKSFSPTDQIPILTAVIATKPDVIIIAPTDSKALFTPLKQAVDAGIKVVLVDTTLADPSIAVAQVSSDNIAAGKVAAETLAGLLKGQKGSVVTVNLTAGVTTTDDREKGFADGLKATADLSYIGQQFSKNSVQTATSIVSATLAAHPDLVGVFSTAAFNTEGAVAALKSSNKAATVKIVGFDANPSGIKQIQDGSVAAQVVLKPYDEGRAAAQQALNALDGKPVVKVTSTGADVATKDNLQSAEIQKYLYSFTCPTT